MLDRIWVLHWHTQDPFRRLATEARLRVAGVLDAAGEPAAPSAEEFVFLLTLL
jgi:hypothetical protein